jgi:ATP-dependent Lhr-like helicase
MDDAYFHPITSQWFSQRFGEPTPPQALGWDRIRTGRDTLIAAPTGSGKTLAAFLWWIDHLLKAAMTGSLEDQTTLVYVSPLKALGNDIQKNLQEPLAEIEKLATASGISLPQIRVAVRSGDTPAQERELMVRKPPHILITTPESLYILLTAERPRRFLSNARAVIVDEIHSLSGDKRGSHLALSLERLDMLAGGRCQRIGLSATQKPIEEIAQLLVGAERVDREGRPECEIVDVGHRRPWELSIEVPGQPLGPIAIHELWGEIYNRIAELVNAHRTTLVFVNTRRLVERVAHQLSMRLGEGKVAAHHGSLSRPTRLAAERGLKSGEIPVVVATASLELGIDIGHVDLVCHLGAPRALATLLQRVGRSGHYLTAVPKGILFPLTRDELVQCAAAVRAARAGELDRVVIPEQPLDILAQQIVASSASQEVGEEDLWEMVRRAYPYRSLARQEFEQVLSMVSEGVATRYGRRSALVYRDRVNGIVRGRRAARLVSITNGGAIPDTADYDVIEEPQGTFVGKVNEDFAIESLAGDIFLLGNTSWRIRRVAAGKVWVEDAHGAPPTIPFWIGEAPARTAELSAATSDLREEVASRLPDTGAAISWVMAETGVERDGAEQIVEYVAETVAMLRCVPTQQRVVAERFFDESGGMQVVLHAPFGARINRAWGLALRKRFCVTFDFELQAAATDDGIVLSLGEQHSFPLESIFAFLRTSTVEEALVQALLASPMFTNRWRWNATRALALLRHSGGRRVPMPIQRMRAEDLLSAVFPEQVACQDNQIGPIIPPDHPLVNETIRNCLQEAMDLEGLKSILGAIERGELQTIAVETPAPSPMSHEILNANPYAFLDDAPLEERRARAVSLRRIDPDLARDTGALDPAAVTEVRAQAWPDVRDADELHDLLLTVVLLPMEGAREWESFAGELMETRRARVARWRDELGVHRDAYVAAERVAVASIALPEAVFDSDLEVPEVVEGSSPSHDEAVRQIVLGWVQCLGPVTSADLSRRLGLTNSDVDQALLALEGAGVVLRGKFTPGVGETVEWCERRLLSRIHRLTIQSLRREIEPVSAANFVRFLLRWQHVQPGTQLHGRDGLASVIAQLQGLELPSPAWESQVFAARLQRYDPADLEYLCLSGVVTWGRLASGTDEEEPIPRSRDGRQSSRPDPPVSRSRANRRRRGRPQRNTPLAFLLRENLPAFVAPLRSLEDEMAGLSSAAQDVAGYLKGRGASFMNEIAKSTGRMPVEVEEGLWELVSAGLVSGDGVAGLRLLLRIGAKPRRSHPRLRALPGAKMPPRPLPVGRWSLWRIETESLDREERDQAIARQLLRRYGVVFRDLLARERGAPSWRTLLAIYRRWEARQEIRGGRFVAGFVGEQFALPEAVEALRAVRRIPEEDDVILVSAADPLNLLGVIVPGDRLSPLSGETIAYRNGAPTEVAPLGRLLSNLRARDGQPLASQL